MAKLSTLTTCKKTRSFVKSRLVFKSILLKDFHFVNFILRHLYITKVTYKVLERGINDTSTFTHTYTNNRYKRKHQIIVSIGQFQHRYIIILMYTNLF